MAYINFFVRCGSRYETTKNNGYAHFLEHILLKGPNIFENENEFYQELEELGTDLNGWTYQEYVYFPFCLPVAGIAKGLELLAKTMIAPRFVKNEIENEKKVVLEEISQYRNKKGEFLSSWRAVVKLIWPDQSLGYDVGGEPEIIRKVTPEALKNFWENFYFASNALLVIAGDSKKEQLSKALTPFGKIASGEKERQFAPVKVKEINQPRSKFIEKDEPYAEILIAFPSISYKDKEYPIQLATSAGLTWGWGSILFEKIRRKQSLVYDIWSEDTYYSDTGFLGVAFRSHPSNAKKVIQEILKALSQVKQKCLTKGNLRRAKALLKADTIEDTDSLRKAAFLVGKQHLLRHYKDPANLLKELEIVTNADVTSFSRKYFINKNLNLVYLGPQSKKYQKQIQNVIKDFKL